MGHKTTNPDQSMQLLFDNRFSIISVLMLFGAFNGYVFAVLFLLKERRKELANVIFAAIMLVFALRLTESSLVVYGLIWKVPYLSATTFPLLFLLGPLFFLYAKRLMEPDFKPGWKYLLTALPMLVYMTRLIPWYMTDLELKSEYLRNNPIWDISEVSLASYVIVAIVILHTGIYLFLAHRKFRAFKLRMEQNWSDDQTMIRMGWLKRMTLFISAYLSGYLILFVCLVFFGQYGAVLDRAWLLLLSVLLQIMGYIGIQQPALAKDDLRELIEAGGNVATELKYLRSGLSAEEATEQYARLTRLMINDRLYLQSGLKASEVASKLSIPAYQLSQALSEAADLNFFDFVNQYRVEVAQQKLINPEFDHLTVLAIALDSGFNNKASFNRAFKKFTKRTPSSFRTEKLHLN